MNDTFELRGGFRDGVCAACLRMVIIVSLLSGFLFGIGALSIILLIPLQIAASRRGGLPLLVASAATAVLGTVLWIVLGPGIQRSLLLVSSLLLLLALPALNWNLVFSKPQIPAWTRVLSAGIIAALSSSMLFLSPGYRANFASTADLLADWPVLVESISALAPTMSVEEFLLAGLSRTMLFSATVTVLYVYGIGRALARGLRDLVPAMEKFDLPVWWIWLYIFPAIGVMAGEWLGFNVVAIISWNLFLLSNCLYALQGLAILSRYSGKRPLLRAMLPGLLILSVHIMGLNMILAIALALLGISSIWIRYSDGTDPVASGQNGSGSAGNS